MRKRTQLVGLETGLNKHTQYAIEFLDNAIDAIESWWWKTDKHPRLQDSFDPEIVAEIKDKLKDELYDSIALSKKLEKDVIELYGYEAGMTTETRPPLDVYRPDDPGDFIE